VHGVDCSVGEYWNLCLSHDVKYAGLFRSVNDFANASNGSILSLDPTASADSFGPSGRVHVVALKTWTSNGPYWIPGAAREKAFKLLEAASGVIVHSLFRAHCDLVVEWAQRTRKPYWSVTHGCLDPWGLARRRVAKRLWLERSGVPFFRHCRGVFFSTERERLKAEPWIGEARSIVTPWPVELADAAGRDAKRGLFRSSHGIASDARVLLYVGRLHSMKRPAELIDAFAQAAMPNCDLLIVGMNGDLTKEQLCRHAAKRGGSRIRLMGPLYGDELAACLAASDAFVSLSHRENFGYAAADALAAGLPVILTPGHDLAYEFSATGVGPNSCGWLLPDDSVASAAIAIREFAGLPMAALGAMGQEAAAWARSHLSRRTFASAVMSELQAETQKSARPEPHHWRVR